MGSSTLLASTDILTFHIAWPWFYLGTGLWGALGGSLLWILLTIVVVVMIRTAGRPSGGPRVEILCLLAAVIVLMQLLPRSNYGLDLIPDSPWTFEGWIAFFTSLGAWCCLLFGALFAFIDCDDAPSAMSVFVLTTLGLSCLLSFCGGIAKTRTNWRETAKATFESLPQKVYSSAPGRSVSQHNPTPSHESVRNVQYYRKRLQDWHTKQNRLKEVLRVFEQDRRKLRELMRDEGLDTRVNVDDSQYGGALLEELSELDEQIQALERQQDILKAAVLRASSQLRRIDRRQRLEASLVLDPAELAALSAIEEEMRSQLIGIHDATDGVLSNFRDDQTIDSIRGRRRDPN